MTIHVRLPHALSCNPVSRRLALASVVWLCVLVGGLVFGCVGAWAGETRLFEASFGPDGTAASAFEQPAAVGVDQATGDVYVEDAAAGTVQKFDSAHEPSEFTGVALNIVGGKLTGFSFSTAEALSQLAVDSSSHVFYVADHGSQSLRAYQSDGEPAEFSAGPGAGTNAIGGFTELCGVAVDANGDIYTGDYFQGVHVYAPSGELITSFAAPQACNVAVDSHGTVYVNQWHSAVLKFTPSEFPVTPSTVYAEAGTVDENISWGVAVDPVSSHLFVDEHVLVAEYDEGGVRLGTFASSGVGALNTSEGVVASEGVAVNSVTGRVYVSDAEGAHRVEVFKPLPPPPPVISGEAATNLTSTPTTGVAADLGARVSPGAQETTCRFEYGTDTSYGTPVPCAPQPGNGTADVPVSEHITGLKADTTYHWRVVASNASGTTTGPDHTFIYTTAGGGLPDNRAYEMVTPPVKDGATIGSVFFGLAPDWSADGSRLIVSSIQCFGDAQSCPAHRSAIGTSFAFSRGSGGWKAHALAPSVSQFAVSTVMNVNADTGGALFSVPTPPGGEDHIYARAFGGALTDVGPVGPPELGARGPNYSVALATADLSRVVVQTQGPLGWPFLSPTEVRSVVEYAGGGPPIPVTVTGGVGSQESIDVCGTELGSKFNLPVAAMAVSADGAKVFFGTQPCAAVGGHPEVPVSDLYARVDRSETVKLSESECGAGGLADEVACRGASPADTLFQGASVDGSKAFFLSTQQLTDNASEDSDTTDSPFASGGCRAAVGVNGCNLYEYDFSLPAGRRLVAVSAGDSSGGGPRVQGIVAVSNDGSHVYFVARGVLSANVNSAGATARVGGENLYVFERDAAHPGGVVRFVATLSEVGKGASSWSDSRLWQDGPGWGNVSPDGRFLVLASNAPLTGDDTRADGGAAQVFRYDALTGTLIRVSIGVGGFNDNGNAGAGDAWMVAGSALYQFAGNSGRRDPTMSDDGRRVFFESPVGLTRGAANDVVIADNEGKVEFAENVYEWEQEGAGSCPAGRSEGCVFLISSGRDASAEIVNACSGFGFALSAVCLIGTDTSGSNVFFTTSERLVPGDTDSQLDFYDARVCTSGDPCVSAAPAPLPPCSGEECHGVPPGRAPSLSGLSAAFSGAGNVLPRPVAPVVRSLTRAQRLAGALRACRRVRSRKGRRACEVLAHRRFGVKSRRASNGRGGRS